MSGYAVKINGLEKLQAVLRKLPKQVRDEVRAEFKESANETANEMKRDVPVDLAKLKNSISVDVKGGLKVSIVAQSNYAAYQEFGTKSKAVIPSELSRYASQFQGPSGISDVDPLVALTAWVRRKGLAATYSVKRYNVSSRSGVRNRRTKAEASREKSIAFMIFRSIKKYGVKPQPFFFTNKSGVKRTEVAKQKLIARLKNIKLG